MSKEKIQKMIDEHETKYNNELADALDKIKQLEAFIDSELGITMKEGQQPASTCASPVSYCSDCGCGKKQRIEGKK